MLLKVLLCFYAPLIALLVLFNFPYDTDPSVTRAPGDAKGKAQVFYDQVYKPEVNGSDVKESDYIELEKLVSKQFGIKEQIQDFVRTYHLEHKKILEVGSGTGSLQDIVRDYTGLDLASSVAKYYHKTFVAASATDMPFPDNSFDAIWTIWVMEHVPQPEKMLMEMRRVLKPRGLLYLEPAWNCDTWAAQGYEVRSYSDFGFGGKVVKASIPVRRLGGALSLVPIRISRLVQYQLNGAETRLRFRTLRPNYEKYWVADSDAAISLDSYETYLWFRSRGDSCMTCGSALEQLGASPLPLVIRVDKK